MNKNLFVSFGEILMRLTTVGNERFSQSNLFQKYFGGGEANVALALANMGYPSKHITRVPENAFGHSIAALLRAEGVDDSGVYYGGSRLGLYFMETGASVRPSQIIYDRAGSSFAEITAEVVNWELQLKDASWFHFTGITPALSQGAADSLLAALKVCKQMGITVSADVNYRKNLWQYGKTVFEVMPQLLTYAHFVFASRKDLLEVLPIEELRVIDQEDFKAVAKLAVKCFPSIKRIIHTNRLSISANHNELSAVCFNGSEVINASPMTINPIVDRIGGGDAFCAGVVASYMDFPSDDMRALKFGLAASVLKHSVVGDYNKVTKSEVEAVMNGAIDGRLLR